MKAAISLIFLVMISISCESDHKSENPDPVIFSYKFLSDPEGWQGSFADYPEGEEENYELIFEYSSLPYPLDETQGALKISGNNHSDDLFMYIRKNISGLIPNASYGIKFLVEFASNVADNQYGVGGSPGEGVVIKAGATAIEPDKKLNLDEGYYTMNIDKGNQIQGGNDMIVIGDFSNDTDQNIYTLKILSNQTSFITKVDEKGELWLIVGSDSGFESTTSIFYNRIEVSLTEL